MTISSSSDGNFKERLQDSYPKQKDELAELRNLLVGPEQEKILDIHHRLNSTEMRARDVSDVLAEAIVLRSVQDNKIAG